MAKMCHKFLLSTCVQTVPTPGGPEGSCSAASLISSLYVWRLAHQFQFCVQHRNPLLCLGFSQTRAKGLGLIGVERKLSKQTCLIGSHKRDGVRTFWHVSTIARTAIRSLLPMRQRIALSLL